MNNFFEKVPCRKLWDRRIRLDPIRPFHMWRRSRIASCRIHLQEIILNEKLGEKATRYEGHQL